MSLAREIGEALMFLRLSKLFVIDRGDFKIRFYPTNISLRLWEARLRRRAIYETDESFFRTYLTPGDVVVDVGANIGFQTLIASTIVGEPGRVVAIEAHPETYKALRGNIKINRRGNVETYNLAIGRQQGQVVFSDKRQDDRNAVVADGRGVSVEMKRLDDLNIEASTIALLKIDVEGYEKFVLEGADRLLEKTLCVHYESFQRHFQEFGYDCVQLNEMINARGFHLFRFKQGKLTSIEPSHISETVENIVGLRDMDDYKQRTGIELRQKAAS